MVLSNILFDQKDHLLFAAAGIGAVKAADYLEERYSSDEDIDLENDPAFNRREADGTDVYIFDPKSESNPDNGGDNTMPNKEAPQYVEETNELLDNLGTALERKDTGTAERRAEEVKDQVYDLLDDLERTEDAFQEYDESMRDHMDDWTDQLDEYLGRLGEMNQQAHNAARDLMETERALQNYNLDDRTEELIDIAHEL